MKLILLTTAVAALMTASACDLAKRDTPTAQWDYGADPHGPAHWALLDPSYVACDDNMNQSPIDFNPHTIGSLATCEDTNLRMDYMPLRNAIAHWTGHAVEVDWTPSPSVHNDSITLKGKQYNLIQFHFHTPSEHRVNDRHADAELHLVHRNPVDQSVAVVGVLLEVVAKNVPMFNFVNVLHHDVDMAYDGVHEEEVNEDEDVDEEDENEVTEEEDTDEEGMFESQDIDWDEEKDVGAEQDNVATDDIDDDAYAEVDSTPLINPASYFENLNNNGARKDGLCHGHAPTSEKAINIDVPLKTVDFTPLMRVLGHFKDRWVYQGSLTTPPCSENVSWNVMQKTFPIGLQQLKALVALQGYNAREIRENKGRPRRNA
ncbi:hypothetical protein BGZ59_000658 [Podila verticillata]|nr:hypothetical protein BGZ59_000658 [Podila verticillata]